jgi:O-antigen/teichoic acid export membrane protein
MRDQKKKGALISYFNIVLSMCSNFVLIPLMIAALSDEEYSIYKVMQSFSGPLIMLNLGISTVAARAVAQYRSSEKPDRRKKENTLAVAFLISASMAVLVLILSGIMAQLLPVLYGSTYSQAMLVKAKQIFIIFSVTMAVRIVNDTFKGCIQGNECFVCFYGEATVQQLIRIVAVVVLMKSGADAVALAMTDLVICGGLLVFNMLYSTLRLGEQIRLYHVDRQELKTIAAFSVAILLQATINQVNSNLDVVILGAVVINKEVITMYSSALSIYTIYSSVISVLVNLYLPKATRLVTQNCTGEGLTDFVIGPGRVQAVLAIGIVAAFALFGKDFIALWIGEKYENAYYVALMLMIPATLPLVQNVCQSILDAQLRRLFSSVVLVVMAILNVMISVILVQPLGFWGAAVGTVVSLLVGHGLLMNIYYHKVIGLNVPRMFREIFAGILPAAVVSGLCCLPLVFLLDSSFLAFAVKCIVFVVLYAAALWLIGLNKTEKAMVKKMMKRKA